MLFGLLILVIQFKKVIIAQKLIKLEKQTDYNKYINTRKFNKLTGESFATTLK